MFPSHNSPNRFTPRGVHKYNNQSPGMFCPMHAQEFYPMRNNSPQNYYSPNGTNQYSPRNSTPNMRSPMNTPNRNYSSNPNSSFESPQRHYSSSSSPGRQYWNKHSFNQSRNSSEYYSSGNSSFSDSSRGSPYGNRRQSRKAGESSGKGYNIRNYINPSMLENPWAELEKQSKS